MKKKRLLIWICLGTLLLMCMGVHAESSESVATKEDWRWEATISHFSPSIYDTRNSLTSPEDVERRIKQIKEAGYTVVMLDGWHMWTAFQDKRELWTKIDKTRTKIAHKYGLKVISHFDPPVCLSAGTSYKLMSEHPDWLVRGVQNSEPAWLFCINNPGFRSFFFEFLEQYVRETDLDAVMLDECTFGVQECCGCEYCRAKFTEATGEVLPYDDTSDIFFNYDSRLWAKWLVWRQESVADWFRAVNGVLEKARPSDPPITMAYTTHYGLAGRWGPHAQGLDILEVAKAVGFVGTEIMSRNVLDGYRSLFTYRKIKSAVGCLAGGPVFAYIYHGGNPDFAYFGWALLNMNNQTGALKTIPGVDMKRYTAWKYRMKKSKATPLSDVAILFSKYSRDFGRNLKHNQDMIGTAESLADAHIMHDVLLDHEISPETLVKYKLLILPSVMCMDEKQVAAVKTYVKNGGHLLATGNTSLYDEMGFGDGSFQLRELFGADFEDEEVTASSMAIKFADPYGAALSFPYPGPVIKVTKRLSEKVRVSAKLIDASGQRICSAVFENKYGKGRVIYSPCTLGAPNYEGEIRVGGKWTYERQDDLHDFLIAQVELLLEEPDFKAVEIPDRVLATMYIQQTPGHPIMVHLLNATGYSMSPGKTFAASHLGEAFPPLKKDLVFRVKLPGKLKEAFVASPDFEGTKRLEAKTRVDGYTEVAIPKEMLRTYSSVYIFVDDAIRTKK